MNKNLSSLKLFSFLERQKAAEMMEEQIDNEMKKMDEMDDDDIEAVRQRRLKAMQKAHAAKQVRFYFNFFRLNNFSVFFLIFVFRNFC